MHDDESISIEDPIALPNTLNIPEYNSKYGSLWTDLSNAKDIVQGKLNLGYINDTEASKINSFIDDGFMILEQVIPSELIDILNEDIEKIWNEELKGFTLEKFGPVKSEFRNQRVKLKNIYAKLKSARDVNLHSDLTRYINIIFERPALAFQSLSFLYGSTQPIHQDSAYVRVFPPMEMVASWIALQDIEKNSGELEYFVGSNKLPDYKFAGNPVRETWYPDNESKWKQMGDQNHNDYLEWLHTESKKMKLKKSRFIARKGDVLIWSADLAHGGSRVKGNKLIYRKSLVTHYCPLNSIPFYWVHTKHAPKIKYDDYSYYTFNANTVSFD